MLWCNYLPSLKMRVKLSHICCERSEAISRLMMSLRAKRSNLLAWHGDCFIAALLAMTSVAIWLNSYRALC